MQLASTTRQQHHVTWSASCDLVGWVCIASSPTAQVIRSTPLGVLTGRDYYMSRARAEVTEQLQFAVRGVIRSYNAAYPVAVVADFVAVRLPGRFVRD